MEEYCSLCGAKLTEEEIKDWLSWAETCCDGNMCGCYGRPIDPPVCSRNHDEVELLEGIEKIEVTVPANYTADISEEEKKEAEFEDTLNL